MIWKNTLQNYIKSHNCTNSRLINAKKCKTIQCALVLIQMLLRNSERKKLQNNWAPLVLANVLSDVQSEWKWLGWSALHLIYIVWLVRQRATKARNGECATHIRLVHTATGLTFLSTPMCVGVHDIHVSSVHDFAASETHAHRLSISHRTKYVNHLIIIVIGSLDGCELWCKVYTAHLLDNSDKAWSLIHL